MKQTQTRTGARSAAVTLEWMGDANEDEWQQALAAAQISEVPPVALTKRKRWLHLSIELGVVLLIVLGAAGWQWYTTRRHRQEVEAELTTVISAAPWIKTAKVELLDLKADEALVRVFIQPQLAEGAFRQTRAYRKTATGWVLIEPRAALWGKTLKMETRYLTFIYQERDAQAVAEVAPKVDALYPRFFGSFFAEDPASVKRTIAIEVEPTAESLSAFEAQSQTRLIVASPATLVVPARISEADILFHSIALGLLNDLAAEALQRYAHPPYANSFAAPLYLQQLTDSLRLWQLAELDLPADVWHGLASRNYDSFTLASSPEICALHQAKLPFVAQAGTPATPDPSAACPGAWLYSYVTHLTLAQTATFIPAEMTPGLGGPTNPVRKTPHAAASVVLATVLEYAAATYGQARLPLLLANYGSQRSWEGLIPATFGVSAATFEQGWQAYLATHYAIGPAPAQDRNTVQGLEQAGYP